MKELSIEEKAKAYDEAIKKMKSYVVDEFGCTRIKVANIFPELKESEDERIRKELICFLETEIPHCNARDKYIAWVEKQREKKSIWHNEDEEPRRGSLILLIMQSGTPIVAQIIEPNHTFNHGERWAYIDDLLEKQGEQKPQGKTALEAINEEKVDNANKVEPREEKLTEFEKAVKQVMEEAIECGDTRNLKADAEMLLSLAHNSSWNEEDKKKVNSLYVLLDQMVSFNMLSDKDATEFKDWLKVNKERYTWKPSDKQLKTLDEIIDVLHRMQLFGGSSALVFLKHDLMKLRGE